MAERLPPFLLPKRKANVDITKTINHLSLCSGYEGIGLGLRTVLPTLREIAYVEIEGYACANLLKKIEDGLLDEAPVFTDVKKFPFSKFRGCVDILSGGFPCQPFSNAGRKQSTEDERHLFPDIVKGIIACQPTVIFLENVEGIISSKTGDGEPVLKYVLSRLEELDYTATAGIFSAREVGASHLRKRVFILAYSNSVRCNWREVSNSISQRELAFKTFQRPRESLVRSEAERCSGELRELADSISARGEIGLPEQERPDEKGNTREPADGDSESPGGKREVYWPTEPNVGRVVDGCADRVDRIRMLGNAVVPATASKAFCILSERLWKGETNGTRREREAAPHTV